MPIRELLSVIAPPKKPLDNLGDWDAAEKIVGAAFPPDFRELIARYGSGAFFRGHLTVYNPLTLRGLACMIQDEGVYRASREGLYPLPLSVHPDSPGVLPWGRDENGNGYCWLTKGKPEKWPVVYLGHGHEARPLQFRTEITGFLVGYASDRFEALVQPDEPFTDKMRVFTPGRSQAEVAAELLKGRKR
jgi:hypothetical protein